MKESFRAMAVEAQQSGKPISNETKEIVRNMTRDLKNTLEGALADEHASDQTLLNNALAAVEKCATERTKTKTGKVKQAQTTQETASATFHACKNASDDESLLQQAPGHNYGYNFDRNWTHTSNGTAHFSHSEHERHAHNTEFEKCSKLNTTVKNFVVKEQTQSEWCFEVERNHSTWDLIFSENAKTVEKSHDWFEFMDDFEEKNAAKYFQEREECHFARDVHVKRVQECIRLQHVFENDYCTWSGEIDAMCADYDSCYTAKFTIWNTTKFTVKAKEVQRKAQQHALEHIECYSNEILSDKTDISKCDVPTCSDCSPKLDIVYTDPHGQVKCDEDNKENEPCGTAWLTKNYGMYDNSDIPVDACVKCK